MQLPNTTHKLYTYILLATWLVTMNNLEAREDCFACSKKLFNPQECPCKIKDTELSFETCLTFDQTLQTSGRTSFSDPFNAEHRSKEDRPGSGPDECHGKFQICFNKKLTKAAYRLTILNANKNGRNRNEIPLRAEINFSKANEAVIRGGAGFFIPVIAFVCPELPSITSCDAIFPECFCCTGLLINNDINPIPATFPPQTLGSIPNTIAGLYKQIRNGNVAVIIYGGSDCEPFDPYAPRYNPLYTNENGLLEARGGLIRGQLWACNTGCSISNTQNLNACIITQ